MTTIVTFDTTPLRSPSPVAPKLLGDAGMEITFDCLTGDYDDIDDLMAKAGIATKFSLLNGRTVIQTTGTIGDLAIGGDTYTNCAIIGGVKATELPGTGGLWWKYRVTFAQDTGS